MRNLFFLAVFLILPLVNLYAQTKTIKGQVLGTNGDSLKGATVKAKIYETKWNSKEIKYNTTTTNYETETDQEGKFNIIVPDTLNCKILNITHSGYEPKWMILKSEEYVTIKMNKVNTTTSYTSQTIAESIDIRAKLKGKFYIYLINGREQPKVDYLNSKDIRSIEVLESVPYGCTYTTVIIVTSKKR